MTEPTPSASPPRRSLLKPLVFAGALALTFGAGAVAGVAAPEAARHGMMSGGMHAMGAAHLAKLLDEAGATPDQKARIRANMERAFGTMKPLHGRMHATHKELHDILAAPTVDRAALERLRAERMSDFYQASRVMVTALADSAEVLSPAQRAKLAAAMAAHHREH